MIERGGLLQELYQMEVTGGWNRGMRAVSYALLDELRGAVGSILDLGCGAGAFTHGLAAWQAATLVTGADLRYNALETARMRYADLTLTRSDATHLPFASASFDLVTALDMLDQQRVDPYAALAEIRRVVRPGGWLLVRVSAHRWLQGIHDRAFNTGTRFRRLELAELLLQNGFTTVRITYANMLMSLPIIVFRLFQRWGLLPLSLAIYRNGPANWSTEQSLRLEARWLTTGDLPFGISLYGLAYRDA